MSRARSPGRVLTRRPAGLACQNVCATGPVAYYPEAYRIDHSEAPVASGLTLRHGTGKMLGFGVLLIIGAMPRLPGERE